MIWVLCKNPKSGLLGDLGQLGKSSGVVDSQLSQHLAVDLDTGNLQTVHEGGIVHAVHLAGSRDTGDPQGTEVTLLQLAADISVGQGLHDSLVGNTEVLGLGTPVALGHLQNFISSLARHHRALNSSHCKKPPILKRIVSYL